MNSTTLTTTLRLPREDGPAETVTVTTPAGRGAQNKHTKAVQLALDLPTASGPGRAVRIGADPRRVPQPSKVRSKGRGWQRWTEADGRVRYGVASEVNPQQAGLGWAGLTARTVVPADGGEAFAIYRTGSAGSDWAREGDHIRMVPALLQDCLPGLLVNSTELAA
ncbi:hypothetical protein [Kitasatospora fiedleri]|uniref:hypothetical protein n=1 Tax=Kitasatospora fiedleri TaxID=2991545 RepID=UPI00249B0AD6|nr:hypothetical protein [Kitasatospora fiedleri]